MYTTDNAAEKPEAIRQVWFDWRLSFGAVTLTVLLSIAFGHLAVGVITLLLARILLLFGRNSEQSGQDLIFARFISTALTVTAVVMVAISLMIQTKIMAKIFDPSSINEDIPYVSALIVYPSVFVFAVIAHIRLRRHAAAYSGTYDEICYLLRYTMKLSGAMAVVDWTYYYAFYINVNFNSPDRYYFYAVPLVLYLVSLVYLGMRYNSEACLARAEAAAKSRRRRELCRCLVIHDGQLLLSKDASGLYDTPYIGKGDAEAVTASLRTDTDAIDLRRLYYFDEGADQGRHYVCMIHGRLPDRLPGRWMTVAEVQSLSRVYRLTPELCSEILRIYTIATTWQTYDRTGRRKHPDKGYRPTFSLSDSLNRDIDFQDDRWLYIAAHNQDTPLWRLRRLLCR